VTIPRPTSAHRGKGHANGPVDSSPIDHAALFSAQIQSVQMAAQNKDHPERLSTFEQPTVFDQAAWESHPREYALRYASVAEPARAFDVSGDGNPENPPLRVNDSSIRRIEPGGSADYILYAAPFSPISAFSPDKGTFGNGIPYVTVVADGKGEAVLRVFAGNGVINHIRINVASPVASGNLSLQATVINKVK
jgi:hypothetical protein